MASKLNINFITEDRVWKPCIPSLRKEAKKALQLTLKMEEIAAPQTLSIVLANDAFVQNYNRDYRGKNKPTNILSFSSDEEEYLGDLLLAYETIENEAIEQKKTFEHHVIHLLVHGTLHLLGYDHEANDEAIVMENREISILSKLGIENPYE